MEIVRFWLPPVVLGLVVSICGVGVAEVSGLTPDPAATSARSTMPTKPEPSPAQVEAAQAIDVEPPSAPSTSMPTPTKQPEPEPERESEPESEPTPTAEPTPTPAPDPTPAAELSAATGPSPAPELAPIASPEPAPTPPPVLPAHVIDLAKWKLTLPTGASGRPTEIRQPQLGQFIAPGMFWLDESGQGVVFRAAAGGVTTENSDYPRSELREMNADGSDEAGWSNAAGEHVMTITQAITALPSAKPHVVAGQIHDEDDDILMIRLERNRLFVEADGDDIGVLDANYQLGTKFTVEIKATPAGIAVSYNGSPAVALSTVSRGLYFKAGCYTQSNPSKGDSPESYGEVVIYALAVQHS